MKSLLPGRAGNFGGSQKKSPMNREKNVITPRRSALYWKTKRYYIEPYSTIREICENCASEPNLVTSSNDLAWTHNLGSRTGKDQRKGFWPCYTVMTFHMRSWNLTSETHKWKAFYAQWILVISRKSAKNFCVWSHISMRLQRTPILFKLWPNKCLKNILSKFHSDLRYDDQPSKYGLGGAKRAF